MHGEPTLQNNKVPQSSSGTKHSHSISSIILITLLVSCFLATPALWAVDPSRSISQYGHTSWLVKDGNFSGTPRQITQTADGYIWIGTTEGLFRFDGIHFLHWSPPVGEDLPSLRVNSLLSTPDGSLWIGTLKGISQWKNGHLANISGETGVVPAITEAHDGKVWFVLNRSSGAATPLCKVVGAGMRCYGATDGAPVDACYSLVQDAQGSFWIGCENGLAEWNLNEHYVFKPRIDKPSENGPSIRSLISVPDGSIWVGMATAGRGRGLSRLEQRSWKAVQMPGLDGSTLSSNRLFMDHENTLWVATDEKGVYRIVQGKADSFRHLDGLSSDDVIDIFEDHEGNLWTATTVGIDKFRNLPVTSFSSREGLKNQEVDGILATSDDSIWIGGYGAIDILNQGKVKSIVKGKGLPGELVTSFFQDHAGRIWVGIDNSLNVYHDGTFKRISRKSGRPFGMVTGIAEDINHDIWVETSGSPRELIRIRDFIEQEAFPAPQTPPARRVAASPRGGIWRGLQSGTIENRLGVQTQTFHYASEPGSRIEQIVVNPDGSVLAASPPGLIGWKEGKQLILSTRNGLPCSTVYSFVSDQLGNLWLSMPCGIVRIPNADLQKWWNDSNALVHSKLFDALDGAQPEVVAFQSGATRSVDGRLWFAAGVLLQMIDPDHLEINPIVPPVHIEGVIADRKNYSPLDGLRLPALTRDLEIDYSALSFTVPEKVRFRYRLEGRDVDWQDPGMRRQAFYSDLRPGPYRFRVIACNNDGLWNEVGAGLEFSVKSAWFQTVSFRLLCVAALLLIVWIIYQLRVRQIAAALSFRFDERLAERTRLARELHDTFLQTVQGSKMIADDALDADADQTRMRQALEKLSRWLGQAVDEGRAALHSLRVTTTEKNHLSEALRRATEDHQLPSSMTVAFSVIGDPKDLHPIVRDEVYRIGYEAIRNAAAHSRASRLEIDLRYANDLSLRIKDNGLGIDPSIPELGREGHFGLQGMRERASRIRSKLTIVSSANAGTEVSLVVPGAVVYRNEHPTPLERLKEGIRRFFRSSKSDGI
jgi:signal transduction histidine kinase/ligand-binding sensor domain-containing protein